MLKRFASLNSKSDPSPRPSPLRKGRGESTAALWRNEDFGQGRECRGGYAEKGRAGAREDACPRGIRGWAIAQKQPRPGGRLGCRSGHDGPEAHGPALPPVNELVDLNVHFLGDRGHAIARRVEASDVGGTRHGSRARAEDPEVAASLTALAERRGAADDGVLARVGRAGQLDRDHASRVSDDEILRGERSEERLEGKE